MPSVQDPSALAAITPKTVDDGAGLVGGILQLKNRPNLAQVGAAPTQVQYNLLLTTLANLGLITTA